MMFQQDAHPQHPHLDARDASASSGPGGGGGAAMLAPATAAADTSAGGLSRANSLARTRAVATLRRAASARELKRAASQNRHDLSRGATPSPAPTQAPSDEASASVLTAPELLSAAPDADALETLAPTGDGEQVYAHAGAIPIPGSHSADLNHTNGANLGAGGGGDSLNPSPASVSALTAAFAAASIPAPLGMAPTSDVAAAMSILAAAAAARNGLMVNPHTGAVTASNGVGVSGAPAAALLQPPHTGLLPTGLSMTPPIARTPPHLTTPGPTMASQVARTYAMAKLLGAAGLQMEAAEQPVTTAQPQADVVSPPSPNAEPEPFHQTDSEPTYAPEVKEAADSEDDSAAVPRDDEEDEEKAAEPEQRLGAAAEPPSIPAGAVAGPLRHRESRLDDQLEEYIPSEDEDDNDDVVLQPEAQDLSASTSSPSDALLSYHAAPITDVSSSSTLDDELYSPMPAIASRFPNAPGPQDIVFAPFPTDVPVDADDSPYSRQYSGGFEAVVEPGPHDSAEPVLSSPSATSARQEASPVPFQADVTLAEERSKPLPQPPPAVEREICIPYHPEQEREEAAATATPMPSPGEDSLGVMLQPEADEPLTSVNSLDTPGLLLSATVNQIKSSTEFEEKFLLLFSDTLVIAKPLAPPEGMEGGPRLRAESFMEKPDLDWSFSVERVVHLHRVGLIVHRDRATVSKPHALMPSFVRHFASNPDGAIDQLVSLTGLKKDSRTVAKLLYQTPELDPQQLCDFICAPQRKEILDAYIGLHAVTGVSIESGLRSFLLGIRFPNDRQAFKNLLISFSKHWVASNRALIKPTFSAGLAANLIFYIMALNDALHATETSRQMFSGPRPNYSEADFLQEFRKLDAFGVLSDRTLGRIFASVRAEPIQQALAPREGPRLAVRVEKGLPTKLSTHVTSDPITVVIDRRDPDFAIRLYGKDLIFDPPVLSFATSNRATFTITPRSLDAKSVTFVKIGRRAPHYLSIPPPEGSTDVALPKSFNVTIEPRELRHTFTLTIAQGDAVKHKVTLSAEDAHRKRVITNALKERIDICISKKRAQSREQAAKEAAATATSATSSQSAAANGSSHQLGRPGRIREPSPIPPLHPSGAETFLYCEPAAESFLRRVYNHCTPFTSPATVAPHLSSGTADGGEGGSEGLKPHVTLTFAQSLDAKIAGLGGKQLMLSGEESMLMTHSLRTLHDGILVGAGTAVNDNPLLNARLLPSPPPVERLPRPIVLDTQLRTPANCKLLQNYRQGTGRQPLFVCARTASGVRAAELEKAGAELVVASCEFDGLLSWRVVLAALARKGITRLMVEGGARVISGLLDSHYVDTLIVTVAPKLIGPQGISHNATLPLAGPSATGERGASEEFNLVTSRQFGRDVVFAWRRKDDVDQHEPAGEVSARSEHVKMGSGASNGAGHAPPSQVHTRKGSHQIGPMPPIATSAPPYSPVSKASPTSVSAPKMVGVPAPLSATPVSAPPSSSGSSFLGRLASLRRGNSTRRNATAAASTSR